MCWRNKAMGAAKTQKELKPNIKKLKPMWKYCIVKNAHKYVESYLNIWSQVGREGIEWGWGTLARRDKCSWQENIVTLSDVLDQYMPKQHHCYPDNGQCLYKTPNTRRRCVWWSRSEEFTWGLLAERVGFLRRESHQQIVTLLIIRYVLLDIFDDTRDWRTFNSCLSFQLLYNHSLLLQIRHLW